MFRALGTRSVSDACGWGTVTMGLSCPSAGASPPVWRRIAVSWLQESYGVSLQHVSWQP